MALFLLANELQSYRIPAVPATRLLRARDTELQCRCQLPLGAVILLVKHRGMLFSLTSIFTVICRRVKTRPGGGACCSRDKWRWSPAAAAGLGGRWRGGLPPRGLRW